MTVVDFHTHVFPPDVRQRREGYCRLDPAFACLYASPRSRLATVEEAVAAMDADGVDRAVVLGFGWSDAAICRDHNDYLADAARRFPDRISAFGCLQPRDSRWAESEVERLASLGLTGVGELMPHLQGYQLDDPAAMWPLADALQSRGLVLLTHASEPVGHEYVGKGDVTLRSVVRLAEGFPELRIVAAHWGGGLPFYALMPEVAHAIQNVYFDSAATTYLYRPEVYRLVVELVGSERVLFGSDYPLLRAGPMLRKLRAVNLSSSALEDVLGGSAMRLLGLQASQSNR